MQPLLEAAALHSNEFVKKQRTPIVTAAASQHTTTTTTDELTLSVTGSLVTDNDGVVSMTANDQVYGFYYLTQAAKRKKDWEICIKSWAATTVPTVGH